MSSKTPIEWAQATWNPVLGCSKISPGCKSCYAIKDVHRMAGNPNPKIRAANEGLTVIEGHANWTGKVRLVPERLAIPIRTRKPTRYFVNSLSDLFHEELPDQDIDRVFAVMALCPQHTFMVLTKRAKRMSEYLSNQSLHGRVRALMNTPSQMKLPVGRPFVRWPLSWPMKNVWLGVSVEDQQRADERIPYLLNTPAAVRFLSAEPLLGPIDLTRVCLVPEKLGSSRPGVHVDALLGRYYESGLPYLGAWDVDGPVCPSFEKRSIDWVIVGGESGPGARPMHPDWARSLRDQCIGPGVPFLFKQWGAWGWYQGGYAGPRYKARSGTCVRADSFVAWMVRVGKKEAGRFLDGRDWTEFPQLQPRSSQ